MNLVVFPVGTTNIFPISNSTAGGQLLTEFNLRSRESIDTPSEVEYTIGPSYTHSTRDFTVSLLTDGAGAIISSTAIQISEGRSLINGHYVESLAPVVIDIAECNAQLKKEGKPVLKGKLVIGLRVMYSTKQTMSGAMLTETASDFYEGVQVVILPKDGELGEKFTLPVDSPTDEYLVNAHLKLAELEFNQGAIASNTIINNEDKYKVLTADKIKNVSDLISEIYVTKTGLNSKRIYTFSGKGTDPETGLDTWCDSTDSLIIWDSNPNLKTGNNPGKQQAQFLYNPTTGQTQLHLPHKQPDGMKSSSGVSQYYEDRIVNLPVANYGLGTGGTVDKAYTSRIKEIDMKLQKFYRLPEGRLKYFYSGILVDREDLPPIYENNNWDPGDYVLVEQDGTIGMDTTSERLPATMYVVLPGEVSEITYVGTSSVEDELPDPLVADVIEILTVDGDVGTLAVTCTGIQIGSYELTADSDAFDRNDIETVSGFWDLESGWYQGEVGVDYFRVIQHVSDSEENETLYHYYVVSKSGKKHYSEPVWITPQIPLAEEDVIGGFLNVPDTALGSGYVYRDDQGFLRLLDYDLLATGVLAYQLGEDFTSPAGISIEEIQTNLDDYVNQRVAFPNVNQLQNSDNPSIINVYIDLSVEDEVQYLNIYDIDSRFNTVLYIHFTGSADQKTIVNITNCQKVRLDLSVSGNPIFNIFNSNLYYDAAVLDSFTLIEGLGLWYQRYNEDDPNIQVDGMTVELVGRPEAINNEDYWTLDEPNDNHYSYALRSLTFATDGTAIKCSLLVTDDVTSNIATGEYASAFPFIIPQTIGLTYPPSRITKQLKVSGSFVTAYPVSTYTPQGYMLKHTTFTALTQAYTPDNVDGYISGTISFYTRVAEVTQVSGISSTQSIDGWESGKFHIFSGGTAE